MDESDKYRRPKKDSSLTVKCYSDELRRWRRLFENRNISLANAIREILNNQADMTETLNKKSIQ